MLIMDSTSDHSPPLSENAASSWLHWENEISSISGLNLDSTSELSGLVEDKEIAARAVAFVVNSTRKGIVPLCADIANLLRAKRSLEKKVFVLKRENEALRGSTGHSFRTSHSTSPTPPSFSDKSLLHEHGATMQERSRPCSRCSQCSSTVSSSPKLEQTYSFRGHLHSPPEPRAPRRSPRGPRRPPNGLTPAPAHGLADAHFQDSGCDISRAREDGGDRKNSLPEIISQPDGKLLRVSPKISKETQCSLLSHSDSPLEEQFIETVRLNSKLAEELGSARKEIEILKGRLKELEMNQLARESWREQFQVEGEGEDGGAGGDELPEPPYTLLVKPHCNGGGRSRLHYQLPVAGCALYAEPLYGCKCTACDEAMGGEIHASLAHTLNQDLPRFPVNSKLHVQLGDHVVTKGERSGRVRYIGHLDKIGQPNMVFVGLELDAPVGRHDGFFNGKRYFFCTKDHGVFLPLHDIVCKVQPKKTTSLDERSAREKRSLRVHGREASSSLHRTASFSPSNHCTALRHAAHRREAAAMEDAAAPHQHKTEVTSPHEDYAFYKTEVTSQGHSPDESRKRDVTSYETSQTKTDTGRSRGLSSDPPRKREVTSLEMTSFEMRSQKRDAAGQCGEEGEEEEEKEEGGEGGREVEVGSLVPSTWSEKGVQVQVNIDEGEASNCTIDGAA